MIIVGDPNLYGALVLVDGNQLRREKPPRHVMEQFPFRRILDGRARHGGPVVVEHPVKRPHAHRAQPPPMFDADLHRVPVQHLTQINQVLETFRVTVVARERLRDALHPEIVALMVIHDRRRDVPLVRRGEGPDVFHARETLEPELRLEARRNRLVFLHRAGEEPDVPVVHVPGAVDVPAIRVIAVAAAGTARPPGARGIEFAHGLGEHAIIETVVLGDVEVAVGDGHVVPA